MRRKLPRKNSACKKIDGKQLTLKKAERDMNGSLYIVATPIGNLGDISSRGRDVLAMVETIACEDTRRTGALLSALGIERPRLIAYHDHNEERVAPKLLEQLAQGRNVALASDAGTPLLADPGYRLVQRAWQEGVKPIPIPGACLPIAALSVCPFSTQDFIFGGFLPQKSARRKTRLQELRQGGQPLVLFEAPHRMSDCLQDIAEQYPDAQVFVARELTKQFESLYTGSARQVHAELTQGEAFRGEFVLVLEGVSDTVSSVDTQAAKRLLQVLCAELPASQAARITSKVTGVDRSAAYALALSLTKT